MIKIEKIVKIILGIVNNGKTAEVKKKVNGDIIVLEVDKQKKLQIKTEQEGLSK